MTAKPALARAAVAATAAITSQTLDCARVSIRATGSYGPGIGRVGFVVIDLVREPVDNVVDRKDVDYPAPLPEHVTEAWTSSDLHPGTPYRAFFHVYDRTGVNLVAYDRRDFTCQ